MKREHQNIAASTIIGPRRWQGACVSAWPWGRRRQAERAEAGGIGPLEERLILPSGAWDYRARRDLVLTTYS